MESSNNCHLKRIDTVGMKKSLAFVGILKLQPEMLAKYFKVYWTHVKINQILLFTYSCVSCVMHNNFLKFLCSIPTPLAQSLNFCIYLDTCLRKKLRDINSQYCLLDHVFRVIISFGMWISVEYGGCLTKDVFTTFF